MMTETTKPMSKGRAPTEVGVVAIVADDGIYPVDITNREIAFPYNPPEAKGYIAEGHGIDLAVGVTFYFNGSVSLSPSGEDERIVDIPGVAYYVYRTPRFQAVVIEGDVINKPWRGVAMKLTCNRTTTVDQYIPPSPPVSTTITVNFSHTFSTADDPIIGSPDYVAPNGSYRTLYGVEYLYYADEPGKVTTTTQTNWVMTETTPP